MQQLLRSTRASAEAKNGLISKISNQFKQAIVQNQDRNNKMSPNSTVPASVLNPNHFSLRINTSPTLLQNSNQYGSSSAMTNAKDSQLDTSKQQIQPDVKVKQKEDGTMLISNLLQNLHTYGDKKFSK